MSTNTDAIASYDDELPIQYKLPFTEQDVTSSCPFCRNVNQHKLISVDTSSLGEKGAAHVTCTTCLKYYPILLKVELTARLPERVIVFCPSCEKEMVASPSELVRRELLCVWCREPQLTEKLKSIKHL